ncbi:integral membrane protein GPR137B-like isoform X2 [Asterias rubens]|uniref:integral membrane protein GPR137B-like isoform X2 n=1 Tax=Asterias rubens TaxID=7604 RepID=UPI0014557B1B|nr:integral membrane protein GPR137B-like isoform X2 [Asterias rubens]
MEELSWAEMQDAIPSKLGPSLPLFVELGLTITFLVLYGFLFGLVFIQLILILYYGHKRFSYQTVFLFTCLIWAGLRTTLFSFYINNTIEVDTMKIFCYWFFFSFPVCLQFYTLCLLVLYFAQVMCKLKARINPQSHNKQIQYIRVTFAIIMGLFLAMNLSSAILSRVYPNSVALIRVRVCLSGLLFIVAGGFLAYLIWKLSRMSFVGSVLLESRGATLCQTSTACVFIILLYVSRAVYNLIAITTTICPSFGYNWINVSDQSTPEDTSCRKTESRTYFFDNPRRYDSDDDLTRTHSSTNATPSDYLRDNLSIPSTPISSVPHVGYGTIIRSSSYPSGYGIPGTTPPMLFAGIPGNVNLGGYGDATD